MSSNLSSAYRSKATDLGPWLRLAGWICLVGTVAATGAIITQPQVDGWYVQLVKPDFTPPNWIFGPVWSTLYLMMAVAVWLVSEQPSREENEFAVGMFLCQLTANFFWSLFFFQWHLLAISLLTLCTLWVLVATTLFAFWQRSKPAALLLVPYLAWITFAFALNAEIWRLNS